MEQKIMKFDRIEQEVFTQELIAIRRDLHRYPESGWTEFRTTARIITELERLGLEVRWGRDLHVPEKMLGLPSGDVLESCLQRAKAESDRPELIDDMRGGYTGCIAAIEGALPGLTIGMRFDIDCNDVEETEDPDHIPCAEGFRSCHQGCMHACGHDAHAAIGIGAARLLMAYRDRLRGRVLLIFQPAEEGLRGAASMTAAGLLSGCDYLFGAHVGLLAGQDVGTVADSGHGFLSSTKFDIHFHGSAAHAGASPELGRNAVAAASAATLGMLSIPRHHAGSTRINVGTFRGGSGRNVIPAEAVLEAETRGASAELDSYMFEAAKAVCQGAAQMYGCACDMQILGSAGDVTCDEELVHRTAQILSGVEGVNKILHDVDFGGSEDITTMMRAVQEHGGKAAEMILCMPIKAPHHNGRFDVDERVIPLGARIFASLALELEADKA